MRRVIVALGLVALAGCATPYERCLSPATGQLRTIDALIAETEANIARGFALEQVRDVRFDLVPCYDIDGMVRFCREPVAIERSRPVAIDRTVEAGKLQSLRARRAELTMELSVLRADCRARHPEG
ncbi:hypothetical protein [Rhodobaculum claviforme]|uniref:Lipoprotein n=1 Tax=Rhodobaculum claviforme TaxID=1549854 RepID=A0A934TJ32_9RHOB|nr:hypothetical protein [Rhodobaculum claviforme]MBK5926737.1 hypothetical protein [Rhodobaculum claviforme]